MLVVLDFLKNFSKFWYQNLFKSFLNLRALFVLFDDEDGKKYMTENTNTIAGVLLY